MTYFFPFLRQDARWEYSCRSASAERVPVGYCAGGEADGYHSDGHATSDEACACYQLFEVATALEFVEESGLRLQCAVCETWTMGRGRIRGESLTAQVALCPEHQTPDDMAASI